MPDAPVIQASNRFRSQLLKQDAAALERMARAYADIYNRLRGDIDALLLSVEGETLTRGQITRLARFKALMKQTEAELQKFGGFVQVMASEQANIGIDLGEAQARFLLSSIIVGDASISAEFARLPTETIKQLLGFLAPDSPLYQRIEMLAPFTSELVSREIVNGVAVGKNPRVIARSIEAAYGQGLTNAMRMVRTVQLYSYREANRATYIAQGEDVVEGWYWHAQLDNGTCMSCINQHGSFHPLSETLNDHHNGRCAMIPAVKGFPPPMEPGAGEVWFQGQPESVQQEMMGKGMYQAWQDGKFKFGELTQVYNDDIYGGMKRQATLKELAPNLESKAGIDSFLTQELGRATSMTDAIRPPAGKAPRGMGQEYADRRAIANRIDTQIKFRSQLNSTIENYRGQKNQRREITRATTRVQELSKAINSAVEVANGPGDWAFKRELVNGIIEYVSEITRTP